MAPCDGLLELFFQPFITLAGIKNKAAQEEIAAVLGDDKSTVCRQMKKIKLAMQPATRNYA